jgi:hypothetical protein
VHCEIVIERERARGLEISDRRDEQRSPLCLRFTGRELGQREEPRQPNADWCKGGRHQQGLLFYQSGARASIGSRIAVVSLILRSGSEVIYQDNDNE